MKRATQEIFPRDKEPERACAQASSAKLLLSGAGEGGRKKARQPSPTPSRYHRGGTAVLCFSQCTHRHRDTSVQRVRSPRRRGKACVRRVVCSVDPVVFPSPQNNGATIEFKNSVIAFSTKKSCFSRDSSPREPTRTTTMRQRSTTPNSSKGAR